MCLYFPARWLPTSLKRQRHFPYINLSFSQFCLVAHPLFIMHTYTIIHLHHHNKQTPSPHPSKNNRAKKQLQRFLDNFQPFIFTTKQLTKPLSQEAYTTWYSQHITKLRYHPKRPSLQQNTRLPNPSLFYHEYMRLALVALDINGNICLLLRPLLSLNANTNFCNLEALSTCAALALLGLAIIKTHTLEKKTDKKITMHNLHPRMQV